MNRLTKKLTQNEIDIASSILGRKCLDRYGFNRPTKNKEKDIAEIFTKLGKLEDIEEQFGCPMEVFTALIDGVIDDEGGYVVLSGMAIGCDGDIYFTAINGDWYNLKDYKKTWWLKKDRNE